MATILFTYLHFDMFVLDTLDFFTRKLSKLWISNEIVYS